MDERGTVYFFTGLSGAGKTTIGGLFYRRLKSTKPNVVCLDGDEIRPVFCEDSGYTNEDRLRRAARIFRVCKMLSEQGIDVVCCSIAMFENIRIWNRENITNYVEIYIRVNKETLLTRNQKGLYTTGSNVVGVDIPFDEPTTSDLTIQNDGDRTPLELVEIIENALLPIKIQNPLDNTAYWNQYYNNKICPTNPSPFASYVTSLVEKGKTMVELGCGNGRDAVYFAGLGLHIKALDLSNSAIEMLKSMKVENADFLCGDFIDNEVYTTETYDYVYSRFTLHSISQNQEQILLENVYSILKMGGKFFVEVRSVFDSLYGKGIALERNAYFYDNHYRRFIVMEELVDSLKKQGFLIEYAEEKTGFAPFGNDDPKVIRVVAVKCQQEEPNIE